MQGKVKWYDPEKGYGFIAVDDGDDVFVHHSVIDGSGPKYLIDGETVELESEPSSKGWRAVFVRRLVQGVPIRAA